MAHVSDKNSNHCFEISSAHNQDKSRLIIFHHNYNFKKIPHFFGLEDECLKKTELCQYLQELFKPYKGLQEQQQQDTVCPSDYVMNSQGIY